MQKVFFGFSFLLLMGMAFLDMACYAHVRGAGVGMEVVPHDQRWHYDHDYDDEWRSHHAWHEDRRDWDR
jgi:hypothetical protein